jgi:hypothetical protein
MTPALVRLLTPLSGLPERPASDETASRLNISVVFTSVALTLSALKEAGDLAKTLGSHITLVAPQVVPYPLPLTSPPVLIDWNERRFAVIAAESKVETTVRLYLCRDRLEALLLMLKPRSLVVVGGRRRRWWPTREEALARALRRAGHEVVFVETE